MSVRKARWVLFLVFVLTIPLPLLGPLSVFAPTARYVVLASVTAAVALAEGASGPVPMIFLLFALHAVIYLATNCLRPLPVEYKHRLLWSRRSTGG